MLPLHMQNLINMNPGSVDQALDSLINGDIASILQFYAGRKEPPEPNYSSSNTEMESINIINTANMRRDMIGTPATNAGGIRSWEMAAGKKGSWKQRTGMWPNASSLINSLEGSAIPRSSRFIKKKVPASLNVASALHKHSLGFHGLRAAAEAGGGLSRGTGSVKVRKKRVRPSRRVPTTVVKTDTSNFKAMVQRFTGIPDTSQESTEAPSASSSFPEISSSTTSPSSNKPLPHPVLSKISNSPTTAANTTPSAAMVDFPSPLLSPSTPFCQSLPELPFIAGPYHNCTLDDSEDLTISLFDVTCFDELWS